MPKYLVELHDGRKFQVEADAPPSEADVMAALGAPTSPQPSHAAPAGPSWTDRAVDALPTVGGAVGGTVGGIGGSAFGMGVGGVPGAVGGAALGGAAGEAAKQLINRVRGASAPASSLDAAKGIGTQAAVQGGSELAGQGLMKGASMAAHGLMDFAIRPAPTVAEEFGDIAGTALKERLPVGSLTPGGMKGSQLAKGALRESAGNTRRLLTDATAQGTTFDPRAVTGGAIGDLAADVTKQPRAIGDLRRLTGMQAEFDASHPQAVSPLELKDIKQAAQLSAKPIFNAIRRGNAVPAGQQLGARFDKAVGDGSKAALETIDGVGASEARTQGLIGATKAIRHAEVRRLPLMAEMAAPVAGATVGMLSPDTSGTRRVGEGVVTSLATRALLSPRTTSRAALALTAPAIQQAIRQSPRLAALLAALQDTGQPEQGQ